MSNQKSLLLHFFISTTVLSVHAWMVLGENLNSSSKIASLMFTLIVLFGSLIDHLRRTNETRNDRDQTER